MLNNEHLKIENEMLERFTRFCEKRGSKKELIGRMNKVK